MIKIIVAVAGLVLVEAPPNAPIDIHLPSTKGFLNLAPLLGEAGRPKAFSIDEHQLLLLMGDKDETLLKLANPSDLRLEISAVAENGATPDTGNLSRGNYASLDAILPSNRSSIRSECRFAAKSPFDDCTALDANGSQGDLLLGQVRLSGGWKAVDPRKSQYLESTATAATHSLRQFVDDEKRAAELGVELDLVDTFLFEAEVESLEAVQVKDSISFRKVRFYDPGSAMCAALGASECRLLVVENSPLCRRPSSKQVCQGTGEFLGSADTHFAQLFRLTDSYEPLSGVLADPIFIPFAKGGPHKHIVGDGSPKCYGGFVVP